MSKSLQDICREARDRQGMTNQDVADNSNVPLSSVQNFFENCKCKLDTCTVEIS